MRKLNMDFSQTDKPKEVQKLDKANEWAHPVGWWLVSTEGDCEGKSTSDLGEHYGHVVEIALELASLASYKLTFRKSNRPDKIAIGAPRKASRRKVHVTFSDGPFANPIVKDVYNWFGIDDILVTKSNLYCAVVIEAPKTKG